MKRPKIVAFLVLALLLSPFVLHLGEFFYPLRSSDSDLLISHYPYLVFLQRALFERGEIPLWCGSILSGAPFAANPLAGLWYPPGWVALVLPHPSGSNFLILLHLIWGGYGMYVFLRSAGHSFRGALTGGAAFLLMPKLFAHFAAGHQSLVYAAVWMPWLLWAERTRIRSEGMGAHRLTSGMILGLIFLADVRWGIYSTILVCIYSASLALRLFLRFRLMDWVKSLVLQLWLAFLVAAPLILPLAEYTSLSTRRMMTAADSLAFSLPPLRLIGFVLPEFGGYAEWVFYAGGLGFLAVLIAAGTSELRLRIRFWLVLFAITVLLSLGSYLPFAGLLAKLPFFYLLRVPPRILFINGLAIAVLVASVVDALGDYWPRQTQSSQKALRMTIIAAAGFVLLFVTGMHILIGTAPKGFFWGSAFLLISTLLVFLRLQGALNPGLWWRLALLILALDVAGASLSQVRFRTSTSVFEVGEKVARYLEDQEGVFRVYSPSYSLPQHTAARHEIELADGIDPMQLLGYAGFMQEATGVPVMGYSVTLPPFASADPMTDNQGFIPDARKLGILNVGYIVSAFDLAADGLSLLEIIDDVRVYRNQYVLPRAWVQESGVEIGKRIMPVLDLLISANKVEIQANGPGLLVLSELNYPGWKVWVDGEPANLVSPMGLLRGVWLEDGTHKAVFVFQPIWVYVGVFLGSTGWIAWLWSFMRGLKVSR